MQSCSLLSLSTAVPPYVVEQGEAKARAREAFGGQQALFDRLSGVFDNAGIAQRHIVAPPDWYMHGHGWHDRNALYLEAAEQLFDRRRYGRHRKGRTDARSDRRRGHRFEHRNRDSQPRCPMHGQGRAARRYPPRARLRLGLCRRRQRPRARFAACHGRSWQPVAVRHGRDLFDLDPARQRRSRRRGRDCLVR